MPCRKQGESQTNGMDLCCSGLVTNTAGYCDTIVCITKNKAVYQPKAKCCAGLIPDINSNCKDDCGKKFEVPGSTGRCCGNLLPNTAGFCDKITCVPNKKIVNKDTQQCCSGMYDSNYKCK